MAGTKIGGMKAARTNLKKHGNDFYVRIGTKGGRNGHTGGFAANPELARIAGRKGGRISTRKGIKNGDGKRCKYHRINCRNRQSLYKFKDLQRNKRKPFHKFKSLSLFKQKK